MSFVGIVPETLLESKENVNIMSLRMSGMVPEILLSESSGRQPENGESRRWLGEGAKVILSPGSKSLPRVFCTFRDPFCTGATPISLSLLKRPFAPSPNHFWDLTIFGFSPKTFGLQCQRFLLSSNSRCINQVR